MFEERFSFQGSPFRLAPDPKFFFGSKSHNKAMAYLHYGLRQAEGFIVITGEIGAGKSVLIGHLLDQLDRSNIIAADLPTPNVPSTDLLSHILSAFRIEPAGAGKTAEIEAFEDFLFDQLNHGRRVLLVVDEAQNLPLRTLEELRVLSNMEYDGTPLFQVFLVGQPDFRETMARPDMEQLRQRVIASYHLEPLTHEETERYIEHRLACVGWKGRPRIAGDAYDAIFTASGGVPRKIHKLCNRVLLFAAIESRDGIDGAVVKTVLDEILAEQAANDASAADDVAPLDFVAPPAMAPPVNEEKAPTPEAVEVLGAVIAGSGDKRSLVASEALCESVFDRLKAKRDRAAAHAKAKEDDSRPPRSATLDEVADAIAAARDAQPPQAAKAINDNDEVEIELPPIIADWAKAAELPANSDEKDAEEATPQSGWKRSVCSSIDETRDELMRAHHSVSRLRRQLTEIDSRRRRRRQKIAASLDRADILLTEIRDAWR